MYGLNGSGKSTLSNALSNFELKREDKYESDFNIELIYGDNVRIKKEDSLSKSLYVFNREFIDRHCSSYNKMEPIIYLDEENIVLKDAEDQSLVILLRIKNFS